jgi:hypothetical protein
MMKNKTIAFLVVVSLLALPVMASAAAEFTLGGYIKLHMFWDSAQLNKNIAGPPSRNNDPNNQHGRFQATSQSSRFNFTIKGPELWGAKTTGYLEVDFDQNLEGQQSASHAYTPRLRHAFFRFNWPETELVMGQYWSFFCEYYPEMIQDGPFQGHGQATHRLPQIRLTQTFGLGWAKDDKLSLSAMVGKPTDTNDTGVAPNAALGGQTSETPQLQAKIQYEGDLWGKAGFYGRPRGFSAQVCGAWQRTRYQVARTDIIPAPDLIDQEYKDNWAIQGTLFLPIIPTATKNLAGTMAVTAQAYVGQGLDFIGNDINNSFVSVTGGIPIFIGGVQRAFIPTAFQLNLQRVWGGVITANYYFSNQWFMNVGAGMAVNYGVNGTDARGPFPFATAQPNLVHNWWEVDVNLYYRPITAFKFGVGYVYTKADYYRNNQVQSNTTNIGEAHRVQFAGWFFF